MDIEISNEEKYFAREKNQSAYRIAKRLFDIAASACGLVILSPFIILIALIIYIDDPHGSPFYCQDRVGLDGRVFKFWKFRSMVVGADKMLNELKDQNEKDGPVFKMKDDPRVTRIGKFIRKTSIDELPQLWNVLKGDMSLVGPRPPLPKEVEQYNVRQLRRLSVVPGLTCYWQVRARRDNVSFDEWVDMDLQYINERNFWLDIKLIFRTFKAVFTCQGE